MKKGLALFLALVMVAGVLAGCGGNAKKENKVAINKTGYPIVNEKITLKVMGATNSSFPDDWNDLVMFKEMEKKTNIHLEFSLIDDKFYGEKKNIAFASDDLPDFFYKGNLKPIDEISYGGQNVLIDLKPYFEYTPNLKAALKEFPEAEAGITLSNGKIFTLPILNDIPRDRAMKLWVNKKWLDKLGLQVPTNTEEMYNVLKQFGNNDLNENGKKDEIPLTFWDNGSIKTFLSAFGLMYNYYVDDNGKVIYSPATSAHKDGLAYMRKLYSEGLMDKNSFTQTSEKVVAKGSGTDNLLGMFISMGAILQVGQNRHSDYVLVPPLKTADGKQVWPGRDRYGKGTFAITNKNKYPEATMRWVDYFYSEEGGRLLRVGVKDRDYKEYPDGTWETIVPEGKTKNDVLSKIGTNAGSSSAVRQPGQFMLRERETTNVNSIINKEMEKLTPFLRVPYPQVYFTQNDQKRISILETDLNSAVDQFLARSITGDIDLNNEWDKYLAQLKQMGLDELISIYQKAYDEKYKK